jgi:hypothetical protein
MGRTSGTRVRPSSSSHQDNLYQPPPLPTTAAKLAPYLGPRRPAEGGGGSSALATPRRISISGSIRGTGDVLEVAILVLEGDSLPGGGGAAGPLEHLDIVRFKIGSDWAEKQRVAGLVLQHTSGSAGEQAEPLGWAGGGLGCGACQIVGGTIYSSGSRLAEPIPARRADGQAVVARGAHNLRSRFRVSTRE